MGEVSSSHHGTMGFIVSIFSLQYFCFEVFFVYEPKVDSFKTTLQHSQIGSLINNSTRFEMHIGFVSTSIHENLQCQMGFGNISFAGTAKCMQTSIVSKPKFEIS